MNPNINITHLYKQCIKLPSDINEHLELLNSLAEGLRVTEFGVRTAVSTFAFIAGKPKSLRSYDIQKHPNVDIARDGAENDGVDFIFDIQDTRRVDIEPTDILFIDTLHTYKQLKTELVKHHDKVSKAIIMHDTETFGTVDMEDVYHLEDKYYIDPTSTKVGLQTAIAEFTTEYPEWRVAYETKANNGLTILRKNV